MSNNLNKSLVENTFWNRWGDLKSGISKKNSPFESPKNFDETRKDDKEYLRRFTQQQAKERQKENLKIFAMVLMGALAVGLLMFFLGFIDIKRDKPTASAEGGNQPSESLSKEDAAAMEASIEEEVIKGGFASKEAYFSSELTKQATDVSKELIEFSKKIKSIRKKYDVTELVIEGKLGQITKGKALSGFGIEVITKKNGEFDEVSLISRLKGMSSPVEFFAEGGRIVAHFKNYPASYCAGTNGAAVCGS